MRKPKWFCVLASALFAALIAFGIPIVVGTFVRWLIEPRWFLPVWAGCLLLAFGGWYAGRSARQFYCAFFGQCYRKPIDAQKTA